MKMAWVHEICIQAVFIYGTIIVVEIFCIVCQNEAETIFYFNSFESAYINRI